MDMEVKDIITLALASIGAVLGVLNAWRSWIKDRVRVRIGISIALGESPDRSFLLIEIRNLSDFPITLTRVGLTLPLKSVSHSGVHQLACLD